MKANEVNFNIFLSQSKTQFIIPVYQRNYDWNKQQCKQLLDDILHVGSFDEIKSHFIGSIVFIHDDVYSTSRIRELTIIDGQQRLTTLTILYIAILNLAKKLNDDMLVSEIEETYLINKFAEESEKLKLKPTENNFSALKYLLTNVENVEYKEFSRVIDNYNYFKTRVSEENLEIILKGISKLIFVEISLEREKDDPQRIFESLNSTGLELSQADLIRNYILMGLKYSDQLKIYEKYWKVIENNSYNKELNISKVSEFIRDFLTIENREIPNKNKVYQEFKNKYKVTDVDELEKILKKMTRYSVYYSKLINPKNELDGDIRKNLQYINKVEINVSYPFLLEVYNDFSNSIINKGIFIEILEAIQTFAWRRFIVGLPTNALNKIFMRLYEDIDVSDYLGSLYKSLLRKKSTQRFPKDNEVKSILKEKDVYGISSKNRTYLFERLENYQNQEPVNIENNPDITTEHIFPQNPDEEWKLKLSDNEFTIIKEKYLNSIANLTLSGNNGKLGNKYFLEKKEMNIEGKEQGYKYSRLWLNRYLNQINKWGIDELEERYNILEDRFLKVWKYPNVVIEEEEENGEINIFDADDPTGKRLEYAILLDQKIDVKNITELYKIVIKTLFELNPEIFFVTDLGEKINLTKDKDRLNREFLINDVYYIETTLDSKTKFERLKYALTLMELTDELIIKYSK